LEQYTKAVVTLFNKLPDFILFANSSIINFNPFAQEAFREKNIISNKHTLNSIVMFGIDDNQSKIVYYNK